LQYVATCCSMLQHVAVCWNMLQYVTNTNVHVHVAVYTQVYERQWRVPLRAGLQCVTACCNTLQCVAVNWIHIRIYTYTPIHTGMYAAMMCSFSCWTHSCTLMLLSLSLSPFENWYVYLNAIDSAVILLPRDEFIVITLMSLSPYLCYFSCYCLVCLQVIVYGVALVSRFD